MESDGTLCMCNLCPRAEHCHAQPELMRRCNETSLLCDPGNSSIAIFEHRCECVLSKQKIPSTKNISRIDNRATRDGGGATAWITRPTHHRACYTDGMDDTPGFGRP